MQMFILRIKRNLLSPLKDLK